jgi:hypothetical protein
MLVTWDHGVHPVFPVDLVSGLTVMIQFLDREEMRVNQETGDQREDQGNRVQEERPAIGEWMGDPVPVVLMEKTGVPESRKRVTSVNQVHRASEDLRVHLVLVVTKENLVAMVMRVRSRLEKQE